MSNWNMKGQKMETKKRSCGGCGGSTAWIVTAVNVDASVIVFARDRTEAKKLARRSEWMNDSEWIDLRVKRERRLDALAIQRGSRLIDGTGQDDARIMRNLGWWEVDGNSEECAKCGLFEWNGVPESHLDYDGDDLVCAGCRERKLEKAK